jgi:hypothetical protein
MGNVVEDVETRDALFLQEVDGMRAAFLEHRSQNVTAVQRRLAGALRLQKGALQHALERAGVLGPVVDTPGQLLDALVHKLLQLLPEQRDAAAAVENDLAAGLFF